MILMDKFELKNKTTGIAAEKTIQEIEMLLAKFGASAVIKEYLQDGRCFSLSFKLKDKAFKLPANSEGVYAAMFGGKRQNHRRDAMANRDEQAYRTCWRIIKDWLHAQLSLIASGQAQPDQVLLPYMFNGKQTLYEAYKDGTLRLGDGSDKRGQDDTENGRIIEG
jgi:hypothetical protein